MRFLFCFLFFILLIAPISAQENWAFQADETRLYGAIRAWDETAKTLDFTVVARFQNGGAQSENKAIQRVQLTPDAAIGIVIPSSGDKAPQAADVSDLAPGRRAILAGKTENGVFLVRTIVLIEGGDFKDEGEKPTPFPRAPGKIAEGWPQIVPGHVMGAPVAAQLNGRGSLEIVAPVMFDPESGDKIVSPKPDYAIQLFGWDANGKAAAGWPVVLKSGEGREQRRGQRSDDWSGSPSVADLDNDKADEIITTTPGFDARSLKIVFGDGTDWPFPLGNPKPAAQTSIPLADVDGDEVLDMISGGVFVNILGKDIKNWPEKQRPEGFVQACLGDADGDGKLEVFYAGWSQIEKSAVIFGFDREGKSLAGWPQKVKATPLFVEMGDLMGDAKKEIVAIDGGGQLHVWSLDGQGTANSKTTEDGGSGVIKTGLNATIPPTLADLDGDGKAEILVWDGGAKTIRAFKGNGEGFGNANGQLARLPGLKSKTRLEIAVADLGGDGEMDIFAGNFWIRWKVGQKAVINSLLGDEIAVEVSPSIVDLEGDGKAEILLGSKDGRVWVYQTGMSLKPENLQWATRSGNFRHTGVWEKPARP